MFARSVLATITTVLLSANVLAAPTLKGDITVAAAVVTVGDMFDDAGLAAEDALFRAPKPGTTGRVDLLDIKAAAARIGIEDFETHGLDGVRVSRAATLIDESLLVDLITADLQGRGILTEGMSANTVFSTQFTPFNAEAARHHHQPALSERQRDLHGSL